MVALVGCGSSDEDTAKGGEGASCTDGTNCAAGLLCFVKTDDPAAGVCTAAPAACAGELGCQCLDELKTECSSTSTSCFGQTGAYVLACNQQVRRLEGETCSDVRGCDTGLYCFVPKEGAPGSCTKLPEACGTQPSCDCLDPVRESCDSGSRCSVLGDSATVSCH